MDTQDHKIILVIDDNPDDRELYIRLLKQIHETVYECREAPSSTEGMRLIGERIPDCILLDYSLPGFNGLQILKQLREKHPFLPIILLTGQGNESIAVQAIKDGADNYLVKSTINCDILHLAIRDAIDHGNRQHELAEKDREIHVKSEALQFSEKRYRLLVDGLRDHAIIWLDPKGRIESWNNGAEKVLGYASEEIIGQNFAKFYTAAERARGVPLLTLEAVAGRGTFTAETSLMRKNGDSFWSELVIDALRDSDNKLIGFVAMLHDASATHEARKREEIFGLIVNGVEDYAIYMLDAKGYVHSWNGGAERMKKYREEEIIGRHYSAFFTEEDRNCGRPLDILSEAAAKGQYSSEGWRMCRNGQLFWASTVIDALRDAQGNLIGFSNVTHDITERRNMEMALRYSQKRNELALQGLSVGLWDWNVVTNELYWSKRFKEIVGVDDATFTARLEDFSDRLHPEDRAEILDRLQKHMVDRIPYDVEHRLRRADGSYIWIHACGQGEWDENGAPLRMVGSVEDISGRREIARMKDEFVAMVSHELRTPITAIRGALGLIDGGVAGKLPPEMANLVHIATTNSARLSRIINDILDIEKITSGKLDMNIGIVDIPPFLKHVLEANQAYGEKYKVRFALQGAPATTQVMADPDRLMQVFTNLLSNAAKFSPTGSDVHIAAEDMGGKVRFSVIDRGEGIPEEFRSRIFENFSQADSRSTRARDGTGLGLSIAKKIVIAMNGDLDFDTRVGSGTTFFFDLPHAATDTYTPQLLTNGAAS